MHIRTPHATVNHEKNYDNENNDVNKSSENEKAKYKCFRLIQKQVRPFSNELSCNYARKYIVLAIDNMNISRPKEDEYDAVST